MIYGVTSVLQSRKLTACKVREAVRVNVGGVMYFWVSTLLWSFHVRHFIQPF